ncbi:MAG: 3-methylornithine--L-lysine ligase PylC [Bacillota bacterium]|jgi:pyrrolysine biosynthesis protein PylC
MTKVCVIGGKLQGVEALYLANKAGMETTLIDHSNSPLGKNFCGRFICQDVVQYTTDLIKILEEADFVLPALEDKEVLSVLAKLAEEHDIRLVYDREAYAITSSKQRSDALMAEHGLPCPRHYPEGDFPYIVKPSSMSCSEGVEKFTDPEKLASFLTAHQGEAWIAEEFLEGPSYSMEVIGVPGDYRACFTTEILMDKDYDCKRVLSCPDLDPALKQQLREETLALAEMVRLHGIMDVEVIETDGVLRILEIDARIPSQTPITVYHATGLNMMAELAEVFGRNGATAKAKELLERERYVSLEQILVDGTVVRVLGERVLAAAGTLSHRYGFCGADEALTDYEPAKDRWTATLICVADSRAELSAKRQRIPGEISRLIGADVDFYDEEPDH